MTSVWRIPDERLAMNERRVIALDGVRGLAALCVVLPHYFMMIKWQVTIAEAVSIIGVEVFFVLSGFVLAEQIIFCLSRDTRSLLPIFFARRWIRTLPPYILALTIMGILTGHLFDRDFFQHLFFVQNLFSVNDTADLFAPAWSLSVEEWFYVLFPLYLVLMTYLRCTIKLSVALFLLAFFLTKVAGLTIYQESFTVVRRAVIFRLDSICFGFIFFVGLSELHLRKLAFGATIATLLLIVCALALIVLFNQIGETQHRLPQLLVFYVATVFGASLIGLGLACEPAVRKFQVVRWTATWLGRVSYDMYLFHAALMIVVFGAGSSFFGGVLGYFILLSAFCSIVYYFFERPILATRPGYGGGVFRADRIVTVADPTFATLFLDAFWANRKYCLPAIVAIAAITSAVVAVGEQTLTVDIAYVLF
jgi:peptidoglycan/LPS O-acetylase OafA/YrhL